MASADGAQQLKAVDIGQHDVQQRQIELLLQNRLGSICSAIGNLNIKALFCKVDTDQVGDGLLVINYQNALIHACSSRAPLCPRQRATHNKRGRLSRP